MIACKQYYEIDIDLSLFFKCQSAGLFLFFFFFFNDTATTEIYTLSLHDALPISIKPLRPSRSAFRAPRTRQNASALRSEEHTSELQSPCNLVCRLLLEKKNTQPHALRYSLNSSYILHAVLTTARSMLQRPPLRTM